MRIMIKFIRGTEKFMYLGNVIDIWHCSDEHIYIYKDNGTIIRLKASDIQYIHKVDNNGRSIIWQNSKQF